MIINNNLRLGYSIIFFLPAVIFFYSIQGKKKEISTLKYIYFPNGRFLVQETFPNLSSLQRRVKYIKRSLVKFEEETVLYHELAGHPS